MFQRSEFNRKTGVYRSQDSIDHFKFRVTLQKVTSFPNVPQFETAQTPTDDNPPPESTAVSIHWQQKHFSAKELARFSDADKCQTDLHKRYHRECLTQKEGPNHRPSSTDPRIYTYIADDCFEPSTECIASNPEHFFGPKGQQRSDIMLVMATLLEDVNTVLFTITWKPDEQMLLVYPDFNDISSDPYVKEIDSDRRQLYHYSIENISETTDENLGAVDGLAKTFSQLHFQPVVSTYFSTPPRRCCFVTFLLEIESARDFDYNNLHVRYRIRLPDRCEVMAESDNHETRPNKNQQQLIASTHSSQKSATDGVCWLGHIHELSLLCQDDYNFEDHLSVNYEVISIDGWNRERMEGYASQTIPLLPGSLKSELRCYRDLGNDSLLDRLQRHYLGGRSGATFYMNEFHEAHPSNKSSTSLARFGNLTKSTGLLRVSTRIIIQYDTNSTAHKTSSRSNTLDGKRFGVFPAINIDEVLGAYTAAKRRLEAATVQPN